MHQILKKGKYGVFSFLKADGSLRFHVGDFAKTQIQEAFYACLDTYAPTLLRIVFLNYGILSVNYLLKKQRDYRGFLMNFNLMYQMHKHLNS